MLSLAFAWALAATVPVLDNEYVMVTRGQSSCAEPGAPPCGERIVVALEELQLESAGAPQRLVRGEIAVFGPGDAYTVSAGKAFFEVVIKPGHPAAIAPSERIAAEKNALRHDGGDFFVFEEKLEPGDTRARHSHSQRVVIQLNRTTLRQWPDGAQEITVETIPERPSFSPPVVHKVSTVGDTPLRGVIVEFKP
jgi:hypothetical protein